MKHKTTRPTNKVRIQKSFLTIQLGKKNRCKKMRQSFKRFLRRKPFKGRRQVQCQKRRKNKHHNKMITWWWYAGCVALSFQLHGTNTSGLMNTRTCSVERDKKPFSVDLFEQMLQHKRIVLRTQKEFLRVINTWKYLQIIHQVNSALFNCSNTLWTGNCYI